MNDNQQFLAFALKMNKPEPLDGFMSYASEELWAKAMAALADVFQEQNKGHFDSKAFFQAAGLDTADIVMAQRAMTTA